MAEFLIAVHLLSVWCTDPFAFARSPFATYLNFVLEKELAPLGLVELSRHLVPRLRLASQLLVQRADLSVELPLLLLQQSVARGLLFEQ